LQAKPRVSNTTLFRQRILTWPIWWNPICLVHSSVSMSPFHPLVLLLLLLLLLLLPLLLLLLQLQQLQLQLQLHLIT
jgi:hypothetical protein